MKRVLFAAGAGIAVVAAIVSCDDNPRYVYTARRFDPARGCLEKYSAIETLPGDDVSVRCREACFTVRDAVYVSPVCPPLPDNAQALDENAPECQGALDASRIDASCESTAEGDEDAGDDDAADEDAAGGEDGGDAGEQDDAAQAQDAAEEG